MDEIIELDALREVNTCEATFGSIVIKNNELYIPYFNVHFGEEVSCDGEKIVGYVKECYLYFENIKGIVWDYEMSQYMTVGLRECYGGLSFFDHIEYEFWVNYEKGKVILNKDFELSECPWDENLISSIFLSGGDNAIK